MRRFTLPMMDNKLSFPSFRRDLEKFVYSSVSLEVEVENGVEAHSRYTHEISWETKDKGVVEIRSKKENRGEKLLMDKGESQGRPARKEDHRWTSRETNQQQEVGERCNQEWQPQVQTLTTHPEERSRPVTIVPGVMRLSSLKAWPVSGALGVMFVSSKETRPVSHAPGVTLITLGRLPNSDAVVDVRKETAHNPGQTVWLIPLEKNED